jgi:hypothetical protein
MATTTTTTAPARTTIAAPRAAVMGIAGGLVGGVLFGILMAMQGMLPMVAALIGSESAAVGFGVHLAISTGAGAAFGLAVAAIPSILATPVVALAAGAVYGVGWWIAGALVAMPLMLGMNEMVLAVGDMQIQSLMGHLVFGVALAGVVHLAARR